MAAASAPPLAPTAPRSSMRGSGFRPSVVDGADRHLLRRAQFARHEVAGGGEVLDAVRGRRAATAAAWRRSPAAQLPAAAALSSGADRGRVAACTSSSPLSARRSGNSMFDWPEQSHTSPIAISSDAALAPFAPVTLILNGPPPARAGKLALHRPLASVVVVAFEPAKVTLSCSPGVALPLRTIGLPRWTTA